MPGLLKDTLQQIGGIWRRLSAPSRVAVVTTLLLAVGGLLAVTLWARTPSFVVLESELDTPRAAKIADALTDLGIEYETRDRGMTILVPARDLSRARLKLAGEGLIYGQDTPEEKSNSAFEPPEERRARRNKQLQQEIARTIRSFEGIENARVLLSAGKDSPFSHDAKPPSASIVVWSTAGRQISQWQVEGIIRTATNAVTGLTEENVSVMSGQGRPLNRPSKRGPGGSTPDDTLGLRQEEESGLVEKLRGILDGVIGPGLYRIGVTVQMSFDTTHTKRTTYEDEGKVIKKEQSNKTTTPTTAPGGTPDVGSGPVPVNPPGKSEDRTREYMVPTTETEEVKSTPVVTRIAAAVAIDKDRLDEAGRTELTENLKSALGIDEARGDLFSLSTFDFAEIPPPPDFEEVGAFSMDNVFTIVQYVAAGLAGLGLLLFFRGAFRGRPKSEVPARTGSHLDLTVGDEEEPEEAISPKRLQRQRLKTEIARAIERDPRGVSKLVEMWLHEESA